MNMSSLVTHNYDVNQQLFFSNDTINTACNSAGMRKAEDSLTISQRQLEEQSKFLQVEVD